MDVKSFSEVQKQTFQKLLDKLIARNKFTPVEAKNFQALLENARDARNVQLIMEKIKDYGSTVLLDTTGATPPDETRFDDGQYYKNNPHKECPSPPPPLTLLPSGN